MKMFLTHLMKEQGDIMKLRYGFVDGETKTQRNRDIYNISREESTNRQKVLEDKKFKIQMAKAVCLELIKL